MMFPSATAGRTERLMKAKSEDDNNGYTKTYSWDIR